MTIGIDASRVAKPFKTGTETYIIGLIKALSAIDRRNDYILYSPTQINDKMPKLGKNFHFKVLPFGRFWTQIRLSLEMRKHPPDVLFVPAHTLPMITPQKSVVTIHDLGFRHFPELYSKSELKYQNWALSHSIKRARAIITVSEFTKNDILKFFPKVKPDSITVIYEGYDEKIFKKTDSKKTGNPYILFIGRLEEKKNIVGMIKAYALLRQEQNIRHQFILAGKPGFGYEKILAEIEKLPDEIKKDIILTGYVSQEKYIELLREAGVLFFCTFFEGFGLPPLEAFATGVPVVASNRTSLPEICSHAALLVDPEKPFEMAVALSRVINDEKLKNALISKGLARSTLFSWKKTAEKTLEVFENI